MTRTNMLVSVAALIGVLLAFGCTPKPQTSHTQPSQPQQPQQAQQVQQAQSLPTSEKQATYASPEAAVDALARAVASRDRAQLRLLFGPRTIELSTGDQQQDEADMQRLSAALQRGYQFQDAGDGAKNLLIGHRGWPFPVPLVSEDKRWRFDTDAGIEEVMDRRVGKNELDTIATCRYYAAAQELYHQMNPDHTRVQTYAARLASTPGKRDGLYWPAKDGDLQSPLGPLVSAAMERGEIKQPGTGTRQPYRGYFYKVLTRQGPAASGGQKNYVNADGNMTAGFALLAWPADYGHSGVMSFMISKDNVVYQADLGKNTQQVAQSITAFDLDSKWTHTDQSATAATAGMDGGK